MKAICVLTIVLLGTTAGRGLSAELAVKPALQRGAGTKFSISGPVRQYTDAITANWLLRAPRDNPAMLTMFADRDRAPHADLLPWSGEFAGKYLTAAVQVERLSGDEALKKQITAFVRQLIAEQASDGYLGPFPRQFRLTGKASNVKGGETWDAWSHYHAMLALLLWYDDSADPQALVAARRIGDLLCDKFLNTDVPVSAIGSTEMNQAVAHSLAMLYERTGEARYLELCQQVVDDFAAPGAGDYFRLGARGIRFYQLPKPRWESLHPVMALAELYWITGKPEYRQAFETLWWSIVEFDRHNNGGFSSGEQANGNPYDPKPIETCCTIAWIAMSVEMLRVTGDSRVADELELSTLNQVIGLHSPDGKMCTYNTPMDGKRVPSTIDIAFQIRPGSEELNCCSVNSARGFGMISDWALMRDGDSVVLNWYGPGAMTTGIGGVSTKFTQSTAYPVDGHIVLEVSPERPVKFPLKLRIPYWSTNTKVLVDGQTQPTHPGTYAVIDRLWQPSTRVEIQLDMSPRFWVGERECQGRASIYHGPILLALEQPSKGKLIIEDRPLNAIPKLPEFEAASLGRSLKVQPIEGGILVADVKDRSGNSVRLRDFGTAGQNDARYFTWLPIHGLTPQAFTKENPGRTLRPSE